MPMFPLSQRDVDDIAEALRCQAAALFSDSQGEADWQKALRLEALAKGMQANAKAQAAPVRSSAPDRAEAMRV